MKTVAMKEQGMPLADRFQAFPWMLSDLIFPFMMEYLVRLVALSLSAPPPRCVCCLCSVSRAG